MEQQLEQQQNEPESGLKNLRPIIKAVVITAIVIGAAFYFLQGSMVPQDITDQSQELNYWKQKAEDLQSQLVAINQEEPEELEIVEGPDLSNWQDITYNVYEFKIPPTWYYYPEKLEGGVGYSENYFYDANNNELAKIKCPMTEAGYPGLDIESQERSEIQNKRFYDITLWLGTPTTDPEFALTDNDLFLIYIKPHVIADYDWQHTCEIITINKSETKGFAEIYTNIYNSIKVREY